MNGSSIAAQSGRNFLLKISDGTSPTTYNPFPRPPALAPQIMKPYDPSQNDYTG